MNPNDFLDRPSLREFLDKAVTKRRPWPIQDPPRTTPDNETPPLNAPLAEVERWHIMRVARTCQGNIVMAAEQLGISRETLYSKIKKYKVDLKALRDLQLKMSGRGDHWYVKARKSLVRTK